MHPATVAARAAEPLLEVVDPTRARTLTSAFGRAREALAGARVWNINSTDAGGGVAEMLQNLVGISNALGVDTRWLVTEADARFFQITKRLHNNLHGDAGDAGPLGDSEREVYATALASEGRELSALLRPGDLVILHDPQTAGLVTAARAAGARTVWRCHIGRDDANESSLAAWDFLRPWVAQADAHVFTRPSYAPPWLDPGRTAVIAPSIDPLSTKNRPMSDASAAALLSDAGIVAGVRAGQASYVRTDGSTSPVGHPATVIGQRPRYDVPLIVQVSRWDRLKDMEGVLHAAVEHVPGQGSPWHLLLVGPDVRGIADDPEGLAVLEECAAAWEALPAGARTRVSLVTLPMDDVEENAAIVNAIQRHATVVVQKSLQEGFGLTVTEAMWKGRPVVASRVGGLQDQVRCGRTGILVEPSDHEAFGAAVTGLLADPSRRRAFGRAGAARVRTRFLPDRHLLQWVRVLSDVQVG